MRRTRSGTADGTAQQFDREETHMASFNQVILLGNLTRDPQLKYLPSQTPVVEFGLAMNRKYKLQNGEDREEATFVECAAFGRQAEVINQYCQKGKQIMIQGRLKYDQWEDKQGGGKRSKLSVVVEQFQLLGGRGEGGGGGHGGGGGGYEEQDQRPAPTRGPIQNRGGPPQGQRPQSAPPPQQPFGEEEQFKEDDIPF
jgi:single-strand DNA-binding protein